MEHDRPPLASSRAIDVALPLELPRLVAPLEVLRGLPEQNGWRAKPGWEYLGDASPLDLFLGLRSGSTGEGAKPLIAMPRPIMAQSSSVAHGVPLLGGPTRTAFLTTFFTTFGAGFS